ncbi:hypothetical protein SS50377_25854 [Spironucleus salmonicida]|uniref:EF-hand domain-containing protein n=1 Tax=Spironucleus salmonicida TaxID=348837 RepID=V6LLC4_9EUKA|nr:hypothetical protein SS50377_25839 [Spironucleus salmonicida]KAH0571664.1 hypothetical protein SS50377_25854 [Spironucleus salmonicida]|eukprot:EST45440.1 Hypothetical protein SS50377_14633 [Spironucleus salmonicida]
MQASINTYVRLFELVDTSRNGFLDALEVRNIFARFFRAFPPPHLMLNTITSRPNEEMDFLDFFAFCQEFSVLLSNKDYNNVRELLQNSNDEGRPRITTARLAELAQSVGIDLTRGELEGLMWALLGSQQTELDTGMILDIFNAVRLEIQ